MPLRTYRKMFAHTWNQVSISIVWSDLLSWLCWKSIFILKSWLGMTTYDIIKMQQNGFAVKIKKRVILNDIFHFEMSESCDGVVLYAHDFGLFTIVFYFSNLLNPTKRPTTTFFSLNLMRACEKSSHKNPPPLQWLEQTQPSIIAKISLATNHSGSLGCNNGCSPPRKNASLFVCFQG